MTDVSSIGPHLPSLVEEIMKNCENDAMVSSVVKSATDTNDLLDKLTILEDATKKSGLVSAIANIRTAIDNGVSLNDIQSGGIPSL